MLHGIQRNRTGLVLGARSLLDSGRTNCLSSGGYAVSSPFDLLRAVRCCGTRRRRLPAYLSMGSSRLMISRESGST